MIELAEVLRHHAPEYLRRGGARVPGHHRQALRAIVRCRTPELGGQLYQCGACRRTHFGWHSCNHRSCPKCGGAAAAAAAGRGHAAVGYLARYVQNTALGGKALLADEDGRVTFRYTASGTGASRQMTLEAPEFIRRILSHVLPPGLHKVRYFGWLHPNARRRFMKVQTLLAVPLRLTQHALPDPPAHLRCPHCGEFTLQPVGRLPRVKGFATRGPPRARAP